ncbi:MAG: hypothetical protein KDB14_34615 [Planctomycetales bacterium]|nr:hypothetical protein [Planctomycetales bacterium]
MARPTRGKTKSARAEAAPVRTEGPAAGARVDSSDTKPANNTSLPCDGPDEGLNRRRPALLAAALALFLLWLIYLISIALSSS